MLLVMKLLSQGGWAVCPVPLRIMEQAWSSVASNLIAAAKAATEVQVKGGVLCANRHKSCAIGQPVISEHAMTSLLNKACFSLLLPSIVVSDHIEQSV